MLILGAIKNGENLINVPLFSIPFWIQIHNLPVGFMSQVVGENLGNFIGSFLEYDDKSNSNFQRAFMRVKVMVETQLNCSSNIGVWVLIVIFVASWAMWMNYVPKELPWWMIMLAGTEDRNFIFGDFNNLLSYDHKANLEIHS